MALLCCSTLFASTSARADCSSAPALPAGCPGWMPGTTLITMPGPSGCQITIKYCTACCNGIAYAYVYEIDPAGPGPDCDAVNPEDMIYAAAKAVRTIAANGCAPPPCPTGLSINTYIPTCWTESAPTGEYEITPCSSAGCYCQETCQVCLNMGVLQYTNCKTISVGMDCDSSCTTNPGMPWISGTCYSITCHNL